MENAAVSSETGTTHVVGRTPAATTAEERPPFSIGAWAAARWPALIIAAATMPIAVMSLLSSLTWVGRPFPGFLLNGTLVAPNGVDSWSGAAAHLPFTSIVLSALAVWGIAHQRRKAATA